MSSGVDVAATTIFCDDIRQELGNKFSFMGIYSGAVFIRESKTTLPKFCVATTLRRPIGDAPSICFRVLADDKVLAEKEFDAASDTALGDIDNEVAMMTMFFQFAPLEVKVGSKIKARVMYGDVELRAGALAVSLLK